MDKDKLLIIGLTRVRNESSIIKETLNHLSGFCNGGIYVYDDCSTDETVLICESHPNVKKVIKATEWDSNRAKAEFENRQVLLSEAKKYAKPNDWFVYLDADERIEFDWDLINKFDDDVIAVKMKLFDFYITPEDIDKKYFERKWLGPEFREIIMAFKNSTKLRYEHLDQREVSIDRGTIEYLGYVKHYGKAISIEEWEKTCEYYGNHFPQYSEKWINRKGKAVHNGVSDFGNKLIFWQEKEQKGFPLVVEQKSKSLKILITNHHLLKFQGTEVYTLLLSTMLKNLGHQVFVYSKYLGNNVKIKFDEAGIPIVEDLQSYQEIKFDIAHVHHNINAIEVRSLFKQLPIIFVSHGVIPFLEQPPIFNLEISRFIAVSEEVKENLIANNIQEEKILVIRNPIEGNYFFPEKPINEFPRKALVLSNKITSDNLSVISDACNILGIKLELIGDKAKTGDQDFVRSAILNSDIVFSLGRGALESIFCERAVIVFDYQGGDGLVSENNFEEIIKCNLSGRRFKRQYDVIGMVNEIKKYNLNSVQKVGEIAKKYYSANVVINELLNVYEEEIIKQRDFEKTNFKIVDNVVKIINEVQHYSQNIEQKQFENDLVIDRTKSNKIKIGFLATDFFSACPFLRVTTVLYELQRQNKIEFINLIDLEKLKSQESINSIQNFIIVENLKQLDIVVVQREFAVTIPFKEFKRIIGNSKVKIVYEIDDNLINLYPAHPFFELYNSKKEFYIDFLKNSDLITVTTNSLREDFYKYNSKIAVLPNYIDTGIWGNNNDIKKTNKKIKILFSGSKTHLNDLTIIEDAIINIYSRYKEQVEFLFWGDITEKIEKQCDVIKVSKYFNKYSDYAEHLNSLDIDIGLIPLKKNKFNTSKSNIKWLDYSAAGIASILSDVEAYNSSVISELNGILVKNDTKSWIKAIEDLIINSGKRKRIADNARELVFSQYSIQKNAVKWYLYYKNLLDISSESEINVSIIIPTFNQIHFTKQTLESIYNSTKFIPEIIIVDNASTDETVKIIKKDFPEILLIENKENLGFPKAINQGIQAASGKHILIANNDIVLTESWLDRLIEVAESDNKIGIVGPISNEVSGLQKDKEANYKSIEEMHLYGAASREKNKNKVIHFPRVAFLCTLIKRELLEKIGGLDERFSPGNFEDDDFCLRAQLAGYKTVIAQDVFIHHYGSKSFKADGEKKYIDRLKTNREIFVIKWGADPEEIWIKQKSFNHNRSLYISIDTDEFIKNFERAGKHIEDKEYNYALSELELSLNNFDSSSKSYSIISKADLSILTANMALILKDLEKAETYFESALKLNPSSSEACFGLGQVFYQAEMFEQSKAMIEWAIKNNPNNKMAIEALISVNEVLSLPAEHNSLFNEVEMNVETES